MISIDGQAVLSRLVISPELRQSWVEYHQQHYERSALYEELAKIVDVTLHIEVGQTELTLQEWSTVELGDCILLDHCSLKHDTLEGKVMMTIDRREALRAKLKDGNLKILELPIFHEVDIPMDEQNEHDDEDEDEDLFSDLEFPEEDNDEDFNDFDDDEDLLSELDEDHVEEEEGVSEEVPEAEAGETEASAELAEEEAEFEEPVMATPVEEEKGPMTPGEIPVTVVIEAGCVQMTMDQLLLLEPGNLLELNIRPESGVDLTINGKIVGKGELIKLGEALGVRVLKLGRRQL
jgi:flagellar motor switch protein FliN/FliY